MAQFWSHDWQSLLTFENTAIITNSIVIESLKVRAEAK